MRKSEVSFAIKIRAPGLSANLLHDNHMRGAKSIAGVLGAFLLRQVREESVRGLREPHSTDRFKAARCARVQGIGEGRSLVLDRKDRTGHGKLEGQAWR